LTISSTNEAGKWQSATINWKLHDTAVTNLNFYQHFYGTTIQCA